MRGVAQLRVSSKYCTISTTGIRSRVKTTIAEAQKQRLRTTFGGQIQTQFRP